MGILSPIASTMGVFNPTLNSTSASGQYLYALFGPTGIEPLINMSINPNLNFLPYANSANTTQGLISQTSLVQTSGFAFIAGGLSLLFNGLYNFPRFIYVMITESFSYGGLGKFLPFDVAGLTASVVLVYLAILLVLKLTSIVSKPGASMENL
jgi:hypothetical protein